MLSLSIEFLVVNAHYGRKSCIACVGCVVYTYISHAIVTLKVRNTHCPQFGSNDGSNLRSFERLQTVPVIKKKIANHERRVCRTIAEPERHIHYNDTCTMVTKRTMSDGMMFALRALRCC